MRPTAKRSPRIFFSAIYEGDQDRIFILTYPQGKYVTSVHVAGTGLCTDYRGNVWVAEYGGYAELSYDGQILLLRNSPYVEADSCAVDRKSGTLALTSGDNGNVAVFPNGKGPAIPYATGLTTTYYCTYDGTGNLFVIGLLSQQPRLVELRKGATSFKNIAVDEPLDGAHAIQWDGSHLSLEATISHNRITLYQLSIEHGNAKVVGTSVLRTQRYPDWNLALGYQFAITGDTIVQSTGSDARHLDFWRYPSGGHAFRRRHWNGRAIYHIGAVTIDMP